MSTETTAPRPAPSLPDFTLLRDQVMARLAVLLPARGQAPARLHDAMRDALLGPGKRLRPLLTVLAARRFGGDEAAALDAGCAIEMVHAASLVLDDLPCMDNALLRRGRPATHHAFGQDTAILAAIGLLNQAYGLLAALPGVPDTRRVRLVSLMAGAVGPQGLVGGQEIDLHARQQHVAPGQVDELNHLKTGVLFVAALEGGAVLAGAPEDSLPALRRFGRHLGLAFQTLDDVLDVAATAEAAGKDVGQDGGKPTLVSLFGVEGAWRRALDHLRLARAELDGRPSCQLAALLDEVVAGLPLPAGVPRRAG